jgi:glycosyltransferase involved in cell wall biosynthesis
MSERAFDVSIVLNLHSESRYLRRTLRSLEEAVLFARRYGITFELVVILDLPDTATKEWFDDYDFSTFDGYQVTVVDNNSLGLSRNDGIKLTRGDYIWTLDGDDLISYNTFFDAYTSARRRHDTIFFSNYVVGFGTNYFVWEYYGSDRIENVSLFDGHPFVSHIFAHHKIFQKIPYVETPHSRGLAHEDWHFACNAASNGFRFAVIPNTVFFYRQRQDSLLKRANLQKPLVPFSEFFLPENYLASCGSRAVKSDRGPYLCPKWQQISKRVLSSNFFVEFVRAVNKYDPAVNYEQIRSSPMGSNIPESHQLGSAYYDLCKLVGNAIFTDVVLLPFLSTGGADKFLIEVMNGLIKLDPRRRFLCLCGQRALKHDWTERLPRRSTFVDLYRLSCGGTPEQIELLALRIIQSCAPESQIHIKCCEFANQFVRNYDRHLENCSLNYYYFCDNVTLHHGLHFTEGFNFDFISEVGSRLTRVISDHSANIERITSLIDVSSTRFVVLFAKAFPPPLTQANLAKVPTRRLLWASRLDRQKHPDLLLKIGMSLARTLPEVRIDVFGSGVLDSFDPKRFKGCDNISYRGPYNGFESLRTADYGAFLYTSSFDGLPNVILEAMAAGLPVIAPDVGGIGEAVTSETGFLVENSADDDVLVEGYISAIKTLYDERTDVETKRRNALKLLGERHSEEAYFKRLADIFDLEYAGAVPTLLNDFAERIG